MLSTSKAADYLGVSKWQLRQLGSDGKLKPFRSDGNTRYYSQEQLDDFLGVLRQKSDRIVSGYCRVSSKKQSDDLERQINSVKTYLVQQGKPFQIITVFSCKIQGKRSHKARKVVSELVQNLKDTSETHTSTDTTDES
jgi:predicted site-specific integrase-resolvase